MPIQKPPSLHLLYWWLAIFSLFYRCYLVKETPNEDPKGKLPQLTKLARSSSFNQGLANWQNAKMKWDRDRGTSPAKSSSTGAPGTSGASSSGFSNSTGANSSSQADTNTCNDPDLQLNWDEILKSPFNFVEGTKVSVHCVICQQYQLFVTYTPDSFGIFQPRRL